MTARVAPVPAPEDALAPEGCTLEIVRVFDAPRSLVFKAWTEAEHMVRWCGPHGFTCTSCELDMQPGGAYRACMVSPDGQEHWWRGVCRELVAPERLVFTHAWEDADGRPGHETLVTVTLSESDGKTTMTMRQGPFLSTADRDGHQGGWSESFERLAAFVSFLAAETGAAT